MAFVNLAPTTLGLDPQGVSAVCKPVTIGRPANSSLALKPTFRHRTSTATRSSLRIIQNNGTPFPGAGFLAASQRIDWFGTVRARAGFTPVDRLLLYVTGGLAYGDVSYSAQSDFRPGGTIQYPAAFSRTKVGWTAGAGPMGVRAELVGEGRVSLYRPRKRIDDCQSDTGESAVPGRI